MVVISDNRKKSEMEVSTDLVYHCWTLEIKFNENLSLLIIRLVNYSVTISLIYISSYYRRCLGFQWYSLYYPEQRFQWLHHGRLSQIEVSPSWKTEYLDSCITQGMLQERWLSWKAGFNCWQEMYYRDVFSGWVDLEYNTGKNVVIIILENMCAEITSR